MQRTFILIILITFPFVISGQEVTIGGKLLDSESGGTVSNAVVILEPGNNNMVTSDENGKYSFVTFPGR